MSASIPDIPSQHHAALNLAKKPAHFVSGASLSIPPKFSVANTVGYVKGKSAIRIHRQFLGRERNFTGFHFWARGYCVSTIGLDEEKIRAYIRNQEEEERRQEQLPLGGLEPPPGGKWGA